MKDDNKDNLYNISAMYDCKQKKLSSVVPVVVKKSELGDSSTGCAGQDQFHDSQYVERDALPVCFHTRCF